MLKNRNKNETLILAAKKRANSPTQSIQTLSYSQKQQVIERTHYFVKEATQLFKIKTLPFDIQFNLKGRAAGMYRVKKHYFKHYREIRYNPFIFSRYFKDNLNTTVPHEVAHYVSDLIYGLKNIKPHGKEWQQIMSEFGADSSVTANYDIKDVPQKKVRSVTYQCNCGDKQLSIIRHNRVIKQASKYYCKICKQILIEKIAS